jgi:hypothetical protein
MIGIATTIFWIFLILFTITAAYSVKDIQFHFGDPQTSMNAHNQVVFSMPISIVNRGYYDVGHFNVTSRIASEDGSEITRGSTFIPVIRKDELVTAYHNLTLDINDLLENDANYLFNDTDLRIYEAVGLWLAQVIPVQASTNFTIQWGAPLYNFMVGEPQFTVYNMTHSRATVPISFENHAFFDLTGTIQVRMFSGNMQVGEGQTDIKTPQNSRYDGNIDLYFNTTLVDMSSVRFEVYFLSPFFNYGPWVTPYG